jgi:hypothetical protein
MDKNAMMQGLARDMNEKDGVKPLGVETPSILLPPSTWAVGL